MIAKPRCSKKFSIFGTCDCNLERDHDGAHKCACGKEKE